MPARVDPYLAFIDGSSAPRAPDVSRKRTTFGAVAATIMRATPNAQSQGALEKFRKGYEEDKWFKKKKNLTSRGIHMENGVYYLDNRLVIPSNLRQDILKECHDSPYRGHFGTAKTLKEVQAKYWWPTWRADVIKYVSTCHSCQRNKPMMEKPAGLLKQLEVPQCTWESVSMDFIVKLPTTARGNDSILVVVDRLSKMVHLTPCKEASTSEDIALLFTENVFKHHGFPRSVVSDRDVRFTSQFWEDVCVLLGIDRDMSSAFHPETDGQTEVKNRVVEEILRHYINPSMDDWDKWLPCVEFAMNSAHNETIGTSPFKVVYGKNPSSPFDAMLGRERMARPEHPGALDFVSRMQEEVKRAKLHIEAARSRQKEYADRKRKDVQYKVGDKVWLSTKNLNMRSMGKHKLTPRFIGPYEVVKEINEVAVKLRLPEHMKMHDVFHIRLLKPYKTDGRVQPPPQPVEVMGQTEYQIQEVLAHEVRKVGRKNVTFYLIRWEGYGPEFNTWEPEENLTADGSYENIKLAEYWNRLRADAKAHLKRGATFKSTRRLATPAVVAPKKRTRK